MHQYFSIQVIIQQYYSTQWSRQGKGSLLLSSRTLAAFENEILKVHLWPQARGQLKEAWGAYISKHFLQSSAGPSANPSKVANSWDHPAGWWRMCWLRILNGFPHKPVSFAVLKLVSSDAGPSQRTVPWNSRQKGQNLGHKTAGNESIFLNISQYYINLHAVAVDVTSTCSWYNIELRITQYYSILHGHYNTSQYYMSIG